MIKRNLKFSLFIVLITLAFSSCVKNEVTDLTLNFSTKSFIIGQADSIIASVTAIGDISKFPVTWTTSNEKVVSVVNGKIKGISNGAATVTAKSGKLTATCEVTVNNEIAMVLDKGYLLYFGDAFGQGVSNLFELAIAGPSDTLYFFVNTPTTTTTQLEVGDYKTLTSINTISDLVPFSIIPGELDNKIQYFSWYIGGIQSPIVYGDINITSANNNNYTIELNLIDGFGNKIYGSFQGLVNYYDESGTVTSSVSSGVKSKGLPKISRISKF